MSIFGSLGGMLGNLFDQYGGPQVVLTQVLNQMGGVQGVLQKLQQAGLGGQVSSWLGNGSNEPVSPEAIGNAIGHGKIGDIATKLGIPPGSALADDRARTARVDRPHQPQRHRAVPHAAARRDGGFAARSATLTSGPTIRQRFLKVSGAKLATEGGAGSTALVGDRRVTP